MRKITIKQKAVIRNVFIKLIKRILILIILPFAFSVGVVTMLLSIPLWLISGEEIMNSTCDWMALKIIDFYND